MTPAASEGISAPDAGRQAAPLTADAAVIGAGIVGAAVAFRLAAAGAKVVVLEAADAPATGSTGRSAAGVRVQFSEPINVLLSWESIQEYRDFEALYGRPSGYEPLGYLFLVPPAMADAHAAGLAVQRGLGAPVEELSLDAAQRLVPFATDGIALATFGSADGVVDPHAITMAYLAMARERGARVLLGSAVRGAAWDGAAWRLSVPSAPLEVVSAGLVVNAAGAWSGEVAASAGLRVPVAPMLRSVYATAPLAAQHRYPLTIDSASGFYLRSEVRRVIMGRSNHEQPPGFFEGVDFADLERVLGFGLARFPWLAETSLDRRASWWGYYEVTPDENPIIGRMPPLAPGATAWLNACGFSGHGVQQAAMVGRLIAEEALEGRARSIDLGPLRYERFLGVSGEHVGAVRRERNIV